MRDPQSAAAPHAFPSMQAGAHAVGSAHLPFVQIFEPQSPAAPQSLPSGQFGAHAGGWHVPLQTPEAHWVANVQAVPVVQLGEHPPPPWHLPLVQMPDEQSPPAPHGLPNAQVGEHAGAAHTFAVHTPEPHSKLAPQVVPAVQVGAHPWA